MLICSSSALVAIGEEDSDWRAQADKLAEQVFEWSGNHLGLSEVGEAELSRVARTAAGRNIRKDGLTLAGSSAGKVLGRAS